MKKPEAPPGSLRKRALSEEEKALWQAVAKSATPLRRRKAIVLDVNTDAAATPHMVGRQEKPKPIRLPAAKAAKPSPPPLAPLGRRERSQLAKGRKAIDARLDLHGMTQERAHRRLVGFLQGAVADGATFVLVITGKGRASVLEPTAVCCAARCRSGWRCRNCAAWLSASRKPASDTAARARSMSGCGGRGNPRLKE
jgi:DNA-nicking Smr family endonuclease